MNIFLYKYIKIEKYKYIFLFFLLTFTSFLGNECLARPTVNLSPQGTLTVENLQKISKQNDIPLWAMIGILSVEKGKSGYALQNPNGTWDLGVFQVNTIHINELHELGISAEHILNDANVNAVVAGYLLGRHLKNENDIWEAIGSYHSKTPSIKRRYIQAVQSNLLDLVQQQNVDLLFEYVNGQ